MALIQNVPPPVNCARVLSKLIYKTQTYMKQVQVHTCQSKCYPNTTVALICYSVNHLKLSVIYGGSEWYRGLVSYSLHQTCGQGLLCICPSDTDFICFTETQELVFQIDSA